jgi:hypothetical protein
MPVSNLLTRTYAAYCYSLSTLCLADIVFIRHFHYCCFHHNRKFAFLPTLQTSPLHLPALYFCQSIFFSPRIAQSTVGCLVFDVSLYRAASSTSSTLLSCLVCLRLFSLHTYLIDDVLSVSVGKNYWYFHSHSHPFSPDYTFRRV